MTLAADHRLSVTALCLMIAAAGWYYLFYSRAAHRLSAIEAAPANRWRVLLRRLNGLLMLALAGLVYIAAASQFPEKSPSRAAGLLLAIVALLGICVLLAWIDIRMTMNLRNRRRRDKNDNEQPMTAKSYKLLLLTCLSCFLAGCALRPAGLATVKMQIGQRTFTLEIADTPATQERGLMERDSMPADHGMIFVFPEEQERNFWMKNTRFALDILFVDGSGKIVSIHHMRAYDLGTTPSDYPAKYAIELNAGAAAEASAQPGDKLSIPPAAREPK